MEGVVFRVDGCGIYGTKVQLILRDGEGDALLLMHQKVCEKLIIIFIKFFIECACNVLCFCVYIF